MLWQRDLRLPSLNCVANWLLEDHRPVLEICKEERFAVMCHCSCEYNHPARQIKSIRQKQLSLSKWRFWMQRISLARLHNVYKIPSGGGAENIRITSTSDESFIVNRQRLRRNLLPSFPGTLLPWERAVGIVFNSHCSRLISFPDETSCECIR